MQDAQSSFPKRRSNLPGFRDYDQGGAISGERPHPLAMLLPKTFTLPELRQFFEFMLDESIDRGNFRRRISELISFGALTDLGETRSEGRGRPAELYRLDSNRLRRFLDAEDKK